jgi:flagellar assembly protein FliH
VATNRFAWQGEAPAAPPTVVSLMRSAPAPGGQTVTPALRDLPSPSADRMETVEREAYARGVADGQRAGEATADERLEAVTTRVTSAVAELAAVRGALMRRSERDLVRLAVSMAERVLRREVDVDRELLVVMARVAIDRLGEHTAATIHLNPVDHDSVAARHAAELGKSVELVADPSVPRGGCLVRSAFGTIDTGIDSQVKELSRALLGDDADEEQEGLDATPAGA